MDVPEFPLVVAFHEVVVNTILEGFSAFSERAEMTRIFFED